MSIYRIPDHLEEGFRAIQKLDINQVELISASVREVPAGSSLKKISNLLKAQFKIESIENIVEVIYSFGSLLIDETPVEKISGDLAKSFFEYIKKTDLKEQDDLEKKIRIFLVASENIKLTVKATYLQSENNFSFKEARIITDIRHVFRNKKTIDEVDPKFGLIIHQLRISTLNNNKLENIFISLDNKDLLELRRQIERAIEKQKLIENFYSDRIQFLDLND